MLTTLGQGGGGGGITMQQVIQIVVFALIFGGSALQWIFRKLAEKAKQRELTMQQQRQREEMLRTGRGQAGPADAEQASPTAVPAPTSLPTSADEAKRRLQEIAAKRRAQLEQAARGGPAPRPAVPAPAPRQSAPRQAASPVPPAPKPPKRDRSRSEQSRPPTRPQAEAQRQAMPELQRPQQRERSKAENAAGRLAERQHQAQRAEAQRQLVEGQEPSARERAVTAAGNQPGMSSGTAQAAPVAAAAVRTAVGGANGPGGEAINEWRRAFVMAELLKRPLCDRNFDEP